MKAYLVDFALLISVVTEETDENEIAKLAATKLLREFSVGDIVENTLEVSEDEECPYENQQDKMEFL